VESARRCQHPRTAHLDHLGDCASAVDQLSRLGVRVLVGGDERDQAHSLASA
jgi:hypothetical protein